MQDSNNNSPLGLGSAYNALKRLTNAVKDKTDAVAQFARKAFQRKPKEPEFSYADLNRAGRRRANRAARRAGYPPGSWFTVKRTRGTRASYREWLRDLRDRSPGLAAEAMKTWGRP